MLPGPNLSMFRTERELQKFYYDVFRELQWTMDVCPQCKDCISMAGGVCTGLSMAQKAHAMLADAMIINNKFKSYLLLKILTSSILMDFTYF